MSLPDNIGNLSNLRYLGFTASRLASLPSSIGNLRNLASLSIARDRRLDSLPDEVYRLPNLKTLYLGGYYIREMDVAYAFCKLSPLIKNLTRLRTLSLERCSLRNLPKEILQLDSLTINVDLNYLNRAALDPAIVMWLDKHTLKDESGGTWDKRQRKDPLEKAINVVRNNSRNARMLVTGNGRVFLPPCSRGYGTFDVYSPDGRHVFSTSITGRSGRTIQLPDLAPLLYIGVLSTDNYVVQKAVLMK
jgi:Leucine-rich repeat (LRR) protein